jgi:predicted cobalt transporter CbtA
MPTRRSLGWKEGAIWRMPVITVPPRNPGIKWPNELPNSPRARLPRRLSLGLMTTILVDAALVHS